MYVNGNNVRYFDSFGVEQISKEIIKSIGNKNITANIDRIQTYKYICIGFTDVMFKGRVEVYQSMQIFFLPMNMKRMTK